MTYRPECPYSGRHRHEWQRRVFALPRHFYGSPQRRRHALLDEITTREVEHGEWIHYVGGGYLLRLTARSAPVLRLKEAGLSKEARSLIASVMRSDAV